MMRMKYQWNIFWFVSTLTRNVSSHLFRHAATQNKGHRVRFDHQATLASGVISLSTSLRTSKNFEKPVVIILQNKQVRKYQPIYGVLYITLLGFYWFVAHVSKSLVIIHHFSFQWWACAGKIKSNVFQNFWLV